MKKKENVIRPEEVRSLPKPELVELLAANGSGTFTIEQLEADLAAGAPINPDGTVDLIAYSAWLIAKLQQ